MIGTRQIQGEFTPDMLDQVWDFTMGFKFSPSITQYLTEVGGFFNGTKKVIVRGVTEGIIASEWVTANNAWAYTEIDPAPQIIAGRDYYIYVQLAGSGGAFYSGNAGMPKVVSWLYVYETVYEEGSTDLTSSNVTVDTRTWAGCVDFSIASTYIPPSAPFRVKVSGTWVDVEKVFCKISGAWIEVDKMLCKINGSWIE